VTNALASLRAAGATSLRDAIYAALQLAPADRTRPVVLVFSDGRDTASWLSSDDLLAAVRRSGVVVHAVELVEDEATARRASGSATRRSDAASIPVRQPASAFIGEIVAASGGRRWSAAAPVRLPSLFTDALNEMRARYVLTYTPTITAAGWHPVTVRVNRARVELTHRPGYLVPTKP
jgi:VWFA-related protein